MTPSLLYGWFNIRGQPATWPLFTTFDHLFFSLSITLMLSTVNLSTTFDHFNYLLLSTIVEYCLTPLPLAASLLLSQPSTVNCILIQYVLSLSYCQLFKVVICLTIQVKAYYWQLSTSVNLTSITSGVQRHIAVN